MEIFLSPENWIALATLTFLEIVLGIDNILFISIVSNKLSPDKQKSARTLGLTLALLLRIVLLLGITWVIGFSKPLFYLYSIDFSIRDLILLAGGLFLLFKSTIEIHHKMEGHEEGSHSEKKIHSFGGVILQIVALDFIFSFDSILTAIGLTQQIVLMITAVIISIIIMMAFAGKVANFIQKHPTLEILALSFLILIGFMLMIEALHFHVPKGYIYFAVFFSLSVEMINMKVRRRSLEPIKLRKRLKE